MKSQTKSAAEKLPHSVDWTARIPANKTISSATALVTDLEDGSDVTAAMLVSAGAVVAGMITSWVVRAGVNGRDYSILFTATDSDGDIYTQGQRLEVRAETF
jgi:hypothetical protein